MMGYHFLVFSLSTVALALQLRWNIIAFIDNYDYPGGPLLFLKHNIRNPMNLGVTALYLCINWLSDSILLFRFYRVFSSHRFAGVVSVAIVLVQIALGSYWMPDLAALSMNLWIDAPTAPAIAYLTISLSLNVTITFLISVRLLLFDRDMRGIATDPRRPYRAIVKRIAKIVAPYTAVAVFGVVACGVSSPMQNALLPLLGQLQVSSPFGTAHQLTISPC
ncbi:hypothetical protein OBBRIDRAFT_741297 [Obba rivulosa]|uniref:Uncharacterized protein n=1 Tax=Obba rivulosa TaxID=1052685 RepID=A0A8E2DEA1_9APHY|nr:hypothetical protein OBBRIDRAFT_741297 [Obba rivulosa]